MAQKIVLPNSSVFEFYEGADRSQYTKLQGENLNKAPKQLIANDKLVVDIVSALLGAADYWSVESTYPRSYVVKDDDSQLFMSIIDKNTGNDLSDLSKWIPISPNINDDTVSTQTSWSSKRIQDEILAMSIALG